MAKTSTKTAPTPKPLVLPDPTIYVVNHSKLLTDAQVQAMTHACDYQVSTHLAPAWGMLAPAVRYASAATKLTAMSRVISMADTMDEANALGYHTIDGSGVVSGVIGVKVCLDNGATPLTGAFSVASVLSHEVCELAVDPFCASWCDTGRGYMVCAEVCDPVQSDYYTVPAAGGSTASTGPISVSNFVTPSWFNGEATKVSFDFLGNVAKPFTMTKGGYYVRSRSGKVDQVFGQELPDWVRNRKRSPYSRSGQRLRGLPGASLLLGPTITHGF